MIAIQIKKTLDSPTGPMVLDLDLELKKNQIIAFYGASGTGKTSALRILAGLLQPDKGSIQVEGQVWFQSNPKVFSLRPQERNIGFVFQDYALFPNMTVLENLEFAASQGKNVNLDHLLELTELGDLAHKKPKTLSGGQQQRVARARALAQRPKILLLDEPLSALDESIRRKLQFCVLEAHKENQLTTILVSHNKEEIIKLSDWAIQLKEGKVVQQGAPINLFSSKKIPEKFKVSGEILDFTQKDNVVEVQLLVQDHVFKMEIEQKKADSLRVGDQIVLASNDFRPKLYKK